MNFDQLLQSTIPGGAAPTLERHFTGPTPGTPAQYTMMVWRYLDGTYNAEVEITGQVPVKVFQPRHMDDQRGMVHVYSTPDPTSGRKGLNVAVGSGVRVVCWRTIAEAERPAVQIPVLRLVLCDGAVDVLEGHGRVQKNPPKQSPSFPATKQVPACSGPLNGRADRGKLGIKVPENVTPREENRRERSCHILEQVFEKLKRKSTQQKSIASTAKPNASSDDDSETQADTTAPSNDPLPDNTSSNKPEEETGGQA